MSSPGSGSGISNYKDKCYNKYQQDDPKNNAAAAQLEEESQAKRAAMAGQWRTPPLPVFAANTATAAATGRANAPPAVAPPEQVNVQVHVDVDVNVNQLPGSTEDYAKALQEAYRRGAQAAAAMVAAAGETGVVAAAGPQLSAAVSCPDLQQQQQQSKPAAVQLATAQGLGLELEQDPCLSHHAGFSLPPPNPLDMDTDPLPMLEPGMDIPIMQHHAAMPPPSQQPRSQPQPQPLAAPRSLQSQLQQQPHHAGESSTMDSYNHTGPPPVRVMPVQQQQQQQQAGTTRSMSLPDMTTYAAAQEEEKRQKRLARNRASARLRRLRKKNLVDAYETEVGILEKTLQQLQAHEWGAQDNASALTEALSMDRGQQVLDRASRQQAATEILNQQLQLMEQLQEMMQEQYVLQQLAASPDFEDLKESLQLTNEQLQQLSLQQSGWAEEWAALQTIKGSLQAMKENDWLSNEGCSNAAETFLAILHKNQVSKFLLWSDHNAEAIDELDSVNAASQVPAGPVFGFGVESTPGGLGCGEE